jgi:hypothetical protein
MQMNTMQFSGTPASLLANPRPIVVALRFNAQDVPRLWDLASRHYPDSSEDASWFAVAAKAAERGLPAVLEVTMREQLAETEAFFVRNGIQPPEIEELRV